MRRLTTEEFIQQCRAVHGDRYDYSRAVYAGSSATVTIVCPEHGPFLQTPANHVRNKSRCPACSARDSSVARSDSQEQFVAKAVRVHGDRYDYSTVRYTRSTEKVSITCPAHGRFTQLPADHLRGYGCSRCGDEKRGLERRLSTREFIRQSIAVHGDYYDYSKARYTTGNTRVTIGCPVHGDFEQLPYTHLAGSRCPKCAAESRGAQSRATLESFILRSREVHGDKYDYSLAEYRQSTEKLQIVCPEHGVFRQTPSNHLSGCGCPQCGDERIAAKLRLSQAEFVAACRAVHGDRYDYSEARYVRAWDKVAIRCSRHGMFHQRPADHINQRNGCPYCPNPHSKPHRDVESFLRDSGLVFTSNDRTIIAPLELDIFIPEHRLAIGFNGAYWHSQAGEEDKRRRTLHKEKYTRCLQQGIRLLQILDLEWEEESTRKVWQSVILSKVGKQERLHARKTVFQEISHSQASVFLVQNHIQKATSASRWRFGLFHGSELVGVMVFCGHDARHINLSRLAFKSGLTVVGGAQKLFSNALKRLPHKDILTFSNNLYSSGGIYTRLGFAPDADLPPSYQWLFRNRLYNKRQCRHKHLPKLLGDSYDPSLTEHQNMFRAGARCLYDAGYRRWVYRHADHSIVTP